MFMFCFQNSEPKSQIPQTFSQNIYSAYPVYSNSVYLKLIHYFLPKIYLPCIYHLVDEIALQSYSWFPFSCFNLFSSEKFVILELNFVILEHPSLLEIFNFCRHLFIIKPCFSDGFLFLCHFLSYISYRYTEFTKNI